MKNTVYLNSNKLINADSLRYIKTLPDNSIDLIATDPLTLGLKPANGITSGEAKQHIYRGLMKS